MERNKAVEAWGANLTAQGESYIDKMEGQKAVAAWGANLTAQGERYLEEMGQESVSLVELRSDVPAQAAELMVDSYKPGIEIRRTRLAANTFLVVYTVKSDRPAWIVFHEDENGAAGEIIQYIFVESGTHRIAKTKVLGEMSSNLIHVMLHEDLGTIGLFEFPGEDDPVFVDGEIIEEMCLCNY